MSCALCKASLALTVIFSNRIMFLFLQFSNLSFLNLSFFAFSFLITGSRISRPASTARLSYLARKFDKRPVKKGPTNFAGPSLRFHRPAEGQQVLLRASHRSGGRWRAIRRSDGDLDLLGLGFLALGDVQGQHTVLVVGLDAIRV